MQGSAFVRDLVQQYVGSTPTMPTTKRKNHVQIQRKVYSPYGYSYPWDVPWWVQPAVTRPRSRREVRFLSHGLLLEWWNGRHAGLRIQCRNGVGVQLPLRAQYPGGEMVYAVGSGSAVFGYEGSNPSLGTTPR